MNVATAAALLERGRVADAERLCRKILEGNRRDVNALQLLGLIAARTGRLDEAARHYKAARRIDPKRTQPLCGLAEILVVQGRHEDGIAKYDEVLATAPADARAIAGKASALERAGRLDEARSLLAPIVSDGREDPEMACVYAALEQQAGDHAAVVTLLEKHLTQPGLPAGTRRKLCFQLGRSHEKLGDTDAAFAAWQAANAIGAPRFNPARQRAQFDREIALTSADRMPSFARSTNDSERPVFIVGMPRSGSTLVEQILAAHPDVHGAGEREDLLSLIGRLPQEASSKRPYPDVLADLTPPVLDRLARNHVDTLRTLAPRATRVVDKNLSNFRILGLIAMLFPKARVIHCIRDPLDTCLSCFMQPLSPIVHPYSTDLRNLGLYYNEYRRLMDHWKSVLDLPILEIEYETLVANQESESRRLVAFCNLEWNDACLRFHETKRTVSTLSYDQVRQPMYESAVKRHERYEEHLGPLREALGMS